MTNNFERCAAIGKKYERITTQIFENTRFEIMEGYFPDYDVALYNDGQETVYFECKSDSFAVRTNALAIEFEYDGRPSGIQTTKADFWIHYLQGSNRYYLIPTEYLRQVLSDGKWSNTVRGGDGRRSRLYIVEAKHFEQYHDTYVVS